MAPIDLEAVSDDDLVARFLELGLAPDKADHEMRNRKANRAILARFDVEAELKRRPGDLRRLLRQFYNYPNVQVQLNAATATLALFPEDARRKIEEIASWRLPSTGLEAGMRLRALDKKIFVPT
ncbi:DUF2019 domain-containing protein [Mangrovibrevibacter kandeliae]|uniref:DUF2019 domain-containing protein n=1 Tax=Mangrovibrevibacter kandeliae TaxID=2968473 RepID=UPI0021194945|nr:DUF2019 domain-containing protein [Aurantimonas sp. CSK15Z-1]MCQ8783341.1 DUF2019 domain-containing protein [Aurantimonas sp. CSK15Z-1]